MQHTFSKHLFLYKWCKNLDFRNVLQDCDVTTEAGCQQIMYILITSHINILSILMNLFELNFVKFEGHFILFLNLQYIAVISCCTCCSALVMLQWCVDRSFHITFHIVNGISHILAHCFFVNFFSIGFWYGFCHCFQDST